MNRGKPNWEHLNEELHVLIQCEDTPNRAAIKMLRAVQEVRKLLVPAVSALLPPFIRDISVGLP
jgi:protein quaking